MNKKLASLIAMIGLTLGSTTRIIAMVDIIAMDKSAVTTHIVSSKEHQEYLLTQWTEIETVAFKKDSDLPKNVVAQLQTLCTDACNAHINIDRQVRCSITGQAIEKPDTKYLNLFTNRRDRVIEEMITVYNTVTKK